MEYCGGITQFEENFNRMEMRNLARFAVDEHNKKENAMLEFKKLVNVKKLKEVEDIGYYITLEAMDVDKRKVYEAIVWVRHGLGDFKLIDDAPGVTQFDVYVNSLEMQNLARFAVDEHKKENAMLEFKKVVNVKKQKEVEEIRYFITLEAMDGDNLKIYEAIVWVRHRFDDFKLIGDPPAALGGVTEFEGNVNSLEMQNLARFTVDEHNKEENAMLEFKKVVNVKKQKENHKEVAEIRYYITLEAMDGDKLKIYEAIVWVRPWLNFKGLEHFTLIGDAPAACTATA